ncbi:MAG: GNAT family N-acetyltransferase, partial [Acidimicrobiia bacterium]
VSRQASHDDVEVLIAWVLAFQGEAIGHAADEDRIRRNVERRLAAPSTRRGFWLHVVDDRPVAMSGHSGPTPNGIRIGPVYTPPGERGHGYATNLVATQSQWLLDHGHRFCFLYTDLSNPVSNSIYERIGYRQVAESAAYAFNPSTE